jgi:hypothetical protein
MPVTALSCLLFTLIAAAPLLQRCACAQPFAALPAKTPEHSPKAQYDWLF